MAKNEHKREHYTNYQYISVITHYKGKLQHIILIPCFTTYNSTKIDNLLNKILE